MLLRSTAVIALALAALACEPKVPHNVNPTQIDYASFDPAGSPPALPLPNDLALQPSAIASQAGAAQELLLAFAQQGGFPNDQEVPITIDFVRETIDPSGNITRSMPPLDVGTINASTLTVMNLGTVEAFDQPLASDYLPNGDHGTLTLHRSLHLLDPSDPTSPMTRRLDAGGIYIAAVRGGPNGVKTVGGGVLNAQPTMFLLVAAGSNSFLDPQNQLLLPGNSAAERRQAALQLEQLRLAYQLPFGLVDAHFPHSEIAVLTAFHVAPATTHVETDPQAGLIPLPSDFLLGADGHLQPALASPAGPFGPLGPGLSTLDGFSTSAMIFSQTSAPIQAGTVNASSVFLYELSGASPTRLNEVSEVTTAAAQANFVAEPPAITVTPPGGVPVSTLIGLQPAVPALGGTGIVPVLPLKESTEYAVILTDRIKDTSGAPLRRSTLGQLLLFKNPLVDGAGHSAVPGVSDAQAPALEQMRVALEGALQKLSAEKQIEPKQVAMAYTFRTQSITAAAVGLAALPYADKAAAPYPLPGTTQISCPTCTSTVDSVYDRYGLDKTIPRGNVGSIFESTLVTFNNLNDTTGAFNDPTKVKPTPELIPLLLSLPAYPPPGCTPSKANPICPVPLVIFRHGIFGSRAAMLTVADRFAAAGLAVAAIDASKHGARAFCSADNQCLSGSTCVADPKLANQGDAPGPTPGRCSNGTAANGYNFVNQPVLCPKKVDANNVPRDNCAYVGTPVNPGTPAASGNFFLGANLFRTRDTIRQDLIDQSQLIRVLGQDPTNPPPLKSDELFDQLEQMGFVINPVQIYYLGQSLGGIQGVANVATNPRISKVVLNVAGETLTDVFTHSPSLTPRLNALLGQIGITPGTPGYFKFVQTAKWILDPADPANFALHLIQSPLPNLLANPPMLQAPKKVLGQVANCDNTVPNPFNFLAYKSIGLGPDAGSTSTGTLTFFTTDKSAQGQTCLGSGAGAVPHGFLTDWGYFNNGATQDPIIASLTMTAQDQAAAFFSKDIHPPLVP